MENDKLKRFIKTTIREFLNENINNEILTPDYYLDDFYSMDFNDEYSEEQAINEIQKVINYVFKHY